MTSLLKADGLDLVDLWLLEEGLGVFCDAGEEGDDGTLSPLCFLNLLLYLLGADDLESSVVCESLRLRPPPLSFFTIGLSSVLGLEDRRFGGLDPDSFPDSAVSPSLAALLSPCDLGWGRRRKPGPFGCA